MRLKEIVSRLTGLGFERLVVVEDGSPEGSRPIFDALPPQVRILRRAVNLGKVA